MLYQMAMIGFFKLTQMMKWGQKSLENYGQVVMIMIFSSAIVMAGNRPCLEKWFLLFLVFVYAFFMEKVFGM